jgi:ribosome-binding protein aMBF1 (putative translation factor)
MTKKKHTTNAGEILDRKHPSGSADLDLRAGFRQDLEIAELICAARTKAGLSQRALAELVGTSASVICRLEDAEYDGHSMAMLRRIAAALGHRVEVRFVQERKPLEPPERLTLP